MTRLIFKKDTEKEYYYVYNRRDENLGIIMFDYYWNKWIWDQSINVKMSRGCLLEVTNFMGKLSRPGQQKLSLKNLA